MDGHRDVGDRPEDVEPYPFLIGDRASLLWSQILPDLFRKLIQERFAQVWLCFR
jgi:hypothetical protein